MKGEPAPRLCFHCFHCGGEATLIVTYDISVGHFARGSEPCFCQSCHDDWLHIMTDDQRAVVFEKIPLTDERDPITSIVERQRDGFR